jgi:S1-C subfamily serine protease
VAAQATFSAIAGETWLAELSRRIRLEPGERIVEVNRIPTNDASRLPDLLASLRRAESAQVRVARDPRESRDIEVELP